MFNCATNQLAYYPAQLTHQITLYLLLHLPIRLHQEIKTAPSVCLLSAEGTRGVPLLPVIDAIVAVGVKASEDALDLALHTDAADCELGGLSEEH